MLSEGPRHIARVDPKMAAVIAAVGPCTIGRRRGAYAALVRAITAQQVSTSAATAVRRRLQRAAGGHLTPARVAALDEATLRSVGLSRQKTRYVRDLTEHVVSGKLRLDRLRRLADEEVIAELTKVMGIGRWTAEMFLMFVLSRPDILPTDDLGIRVGFERVYGLRKRPSADRMRALARSWRPYRTVGSWYLWRSAELEPG